VEDLLRNKTQEIIILTVWVALRPDFMVSTERVSDVNAGMVLCICVKANETTGHSLQSSILVRCRDLKKFPDFSRCLPVLCWVLIHIYSLIVRSRDV
jgi:hypothetical protein